MSKLLVLTKLMIKSNLSNLGNKKAKAKMNPILLFILIIIIFIASISFPLFKLTQYLYNSLIVANQEGIVLTLAMAAVSLTIFFFGIFYVLTIFYFSKDVEFLLPLPLQPSIILASKLVTTLIYEYITEALFLVPVILGYGIESTASITYYIYSIIVFLILPITPLVLASLINLIIMRFTNIGKHKDALKVIGGILALSLSVGLNMYIQSFNSTSNSSEELIKLLTSGDNSLIKVVARYFPTVKFASIALINNQESQGVMNLVIFIAIAILSIIIFFIIGQKLYFKGVLGNAEVYSKRKVLSNEAMDKASQKNSAVISYMIKELKILFRTPAYLMNCVIMNFIWPIILVFMFFQSSKTGDQGLNDILNLSKNNSILGIVIAIVFSIGMVVAGSNGITATSISREGENLFFNKYIPMDYKRQIMAKIFAGFVLSAIAETLILLILFAALKFSLIMLIPSILVLVEGTLITSFIGIALDLKFPKLHWDSEQKAVKQNFNLLINMFLSWGMAAALIVLIVKLELTLWYAFGALLIIGTIINLCLYFVLSTLGEKWFREIEV